MAGKTVDAPSNGNGAHAPVVAPTAEVHIDRIAAETIDVPIIGTTPLLMHRFSEKAKRQMLDNMQGRKSPKEPKDPEAEYEGAFYRLNDGTPGFPALAFKSATIGGVRFYGKAITMTACKQYLFFRGEVGDDGRALVRIDGEPIMREDVVTVGRGGTDLRYRPEFRQWSTTLRITYVTSALTRASVLSLVDAGGMGVGVGEWRPERNGDFGTYAIDPDRNVAGSAGHGSAARVRACLGMAGLGEAGRAGLGTVRPGRAQHGAVLHGEARQARRGTAGAAWLSAAWYGRAGQGSAGVA